MKCASKCAKKCMRGICGPAGLCSLLAIAVFLLFIGVSHLSDQAYAQSSVRPPDNATTSSAPPPRGLSRQGVPSQAAHPTNVIKGHVPGKALGNTAISDMWQAARKGTIGTVSIPDKNAAQLIQSEGWEWQKQRTGPLLSWGVIAMAGMLILLVLFFLARGRIPVEGGLSGRTITRFADIDRIAHWLLAISFIILALTGLNITYGKHFLLPLLGKPAFAQLAMLGKWLHNYVAFAFIVSLVLVFVLWIKHNFPNRHDIVWLLKGGGLLMKGVHPPSKKFNAGQKILFWLILLGGISISLSGISLLFPFQTAIFAKTFAILNVFGFNLPTELTPLQEMQYASLWHAIVALFLICVVFGHIYIGTVGMQGAFGAMGSGEVDENWAKEHHNLWFEEEKARSAKASSSSGAGDAKVAPAE